MKKISVIIPCYNVDGKLDRALQSIIHQTVSLEEIEIILVNDASSDNGAWENMLEWERKFPDYICLVDCEENRGAGAARNIGLSYATGKYVTFVDADDWIHPNMVQDMFAVAEQYQLDMVVCEAKQVYGKGRLQAKGGGTSERDFYGVIEREDERRMLLLSGNVALGGNVVWGRLFLRHFLLEYDLHFPEHGLLGEDVCFMCLVRIYIRSWYKMENAYYNYFRHPDSTTSICSAMKWITDNLQNQDFLWKEYGKREVLETYYDIFEARYVQGVFCGTLHYLFINFPNCTPDIIQDLIDFVWKKIPNFQENIYLREEDVRRKIVFQERDEFLWKLLCERGNEIDYMAEREKYMQLVKGSLLSVEELRKLSELAEG